MAVRTQTFAHWLNIFYGGTYAKNAPGGMYLEALPAQKITHPPNIFRGLTSAKMHPFAAYI
jgi:hypothetical protein